MWTCSFQSPEPMKSHEQAYVTGSTNRWNVGGSVSAIHNFLHTSTTLWVWAGFFLKKRGRRQEVRGSGCQSGPSRATTKSGLQQLCGTTSLRVQLWPPHGTLTAGGTASLSRWRPSNTSTVLDASPHARHLWSVARSSGYKPPLRARWAGKVAGTPVASFTYLTKHFRVFIFCVFTENLFF